MNKPQRVLIVKPSSLGDIIHSLPFLKALKGLYPEAELYWLVNRGFEKILEGNPYLSGIIPFDRSIWSRDPKKGIKGFIEIVKTIRSMKFDMVFDLQGLFRSGLISFLTGSKERIGLKYSRELSSIFYTKRLGYSKNDNHAVLRNLSILSETRLIEKDLGIPVEEVEFRIIITDKEKERIKELLSFREEDTYIAFNPFGGWKSKRWGVDKYIRLGNLLRKEGYRIVLLGGPKDIEEAKMIASNMEGEPILTAGRTDLKELAALLKHVNLLVTNDTGPMHIAAAVGTPTVAIFGPTDPNRTGPYGEGHIVITSGVDCSPCFRKKCREMICMDSIGVEDVMGAVKRILDQDVKKVKTQSI